MTVPKRSSNGVPLRGVVLLERPRTKTEKRQERRWSPWVVGSDGSSFCLCFLMATKHGEFLTWVTLRLFITFAGYFALGAYYNYTTYGATGVDLIPCVFSLLLMASTLKHSSLAVDIETFGARFHICYEMLSRTFVVLSNHATARVEGDISRYNSWFYIIFLWIILQDSVNKVYRTTTSIMATVCRTRPCDKHYLQDASWMATIVSFTKAKF